MQLATPCPEQSSVALPAAPSQAGTRPVTDVTQEEVRVMVLYLRKARDRAIDIRDRCPAGSYLESVLERTIDGIALELSQLDYLLAGKSGDTAKKTHVHRRMRPAV